MLAVAAGGAMHRRGDLTKLFRVSVANEIRRVYEIDLLASVEIVHMMGYIWAVFAEEREVQKK
jgi:hypothetical protein